VNRLAELEAIVERRAGNCASPIGSQSASVTDGSRCYRCGRQFGAKDIAWRARTAHPSLFGWSIRLEPYCERCCPKNRIYNFPDPCVSCGRQVAVEMDNNIYRRKRLTCLPDCASRAEVTARARRRAQKRRKTCAMCGRSFTGTRADARTCSAACRQKAYRRRAAA
jgi:hypothetical protein